MITRRRLHPHPVLSCLILLLALGMLSPIFAQAQMPDSIAERTPPSVVKMPETDSLALRRFPSPGGAFLRSVLVPGWGQAAYGAYFRGGVYFAAEAGSWYMLLKTVAKLGEAKDIEAWRVRAVRDSVMAAIGANPEMAEQFKAPGSLEAALEKAVDEHPGVIGSRKLVDARKEQREDWIVLTLFWMLASGVDAFVNAHLSDFPAKVNAESRPDGRFDLGVRVPVGGTR